MSARSMQVRGWIERTRAWGVCLALSVAAPAALSAEALPSASGEKRSAAPTDPSAAWARAYVQGRWQLAATLLESVPEAARTGWQWLHLARARVRQGQLVEAFDAYERLRELERPRRGGALRDLQRQGQREADDLEGRIPWAQVELTGSVPRGTFVYVDQTWLEPARLRSPYPVNPGWHTFLLESEGRVLAARRVHFLEGQTQHITLRGLRSSNASPPASSASPPPASSASPPASSVLPAVEPRRPLAWPGARAAAPASDADLPAHRTASHVSFAVSALGFALGTGFAVAAVRNNDALGSYRDDCPGPYCAAEAEVRGSLGRNVALAYGGFAVGGLGLLTGGVLLLLGRDETPAAQLGGVRVEPSLGLGGAAVEGRF